MQILLLVLGAVILAVYVLPIFDGVFNFGNAVGMLFGAGIALCGYFWNKIPFVPQKYIAFLISLLIFIMIFAFSGILSFGRDSAQNGDVLIVLGCRVKGDVPSLALEKRVDACFCFMMNNPKSIAILSGGQGPDENLSEALCMKNMLVYRGIPSERLITEDKSVSTYQNILFSKQLMEQKDIDGKVVICTSEYHQFRARKLCKKLGVEAQHISSATKKSLLPTFLLRESFAVIKESVFR